MWFQSNYKTYMCLIWVLSWSYTSAHSSDPLCPAGNQQALLRRPREVAPCPDSRVYRSPRELLTYYTWLQKLPCCSSCFLHGGNSTWQKRLIKTEAHKNRNSGHAPHTACDSVNGIYQDRQAKPSPASSLQLNLSSGKDLLNENPGKGLKCYESLCATQELVFLSFLVPLQMSQESGVHPVFQWNYCNCAAQFIQWKGTK